MAKDLLLKKGLISSKDVVEFIETEYEDPIDDFVITLKEKAVKL